MNATNNPGRIPAFLALLAVLGGSPAMAQELAVRLDTERFPVMYGGTGAFGWQFTPTQPIQVSALGIFDTPALSPLVGSIGDGLVESHEVRIWDVANPSSPLLSGRVEAGTAAEATGGFRFVRVPPLVLAANRSYVIAAAYTSETTLVLDSFTGDGGDPDFKASIGSALVFEGYRFAPPGGVGPLPFPEFHRPGDNMAFGPNFSYTVVPEPTPLALASCGGIALVAMIAVGDRRGRRRTKPKPEQPMLSQGLGDANR